MADTSLIFNIIAKDSGLGRALDGVTRAFKSTGQSAEEALKKAGSGTDNLDRQIEEAKARVRSLAEEFERTGDKTLFGKISRDRSLISNLERVRGALSSTDNDARRMGDSGSTLDGIFSRVAGAASGAAGSLTSMGGSVMSAASSIAGLVAIAASLSAGMSMAGGAIGLFGGMAASIPGMLSGAIAAIATLKMGLFGLGENWKAMNAPPSGGGGGGGGKSIVDMTPKLRAVEAAQRAVTRSARDLKDAQVAAREAQLAINEAREEARERIEDLSLSLRQARNDEADATQSAAEAAMDLQLAIARGNPDEIHRMQLAYDRQKLAVEEAKDKVGDLAKESTEASKKGVEGSDEVTEAKKREREASRRVSDAAEAHKLAIQQLADAQAALKQKMDAAAASAGGGLGIQLPKIAKSAQAFLDVLKELKPAFDRLRLDVQERLFAGLADKLRIAATRWLPQLHKTLGDMADTINRIVKNAFDSISEPKFIKNIGDAVEGFRKGFEAIGMAVSGPLVDAFGRLAAASAPFMEKVGKKLADIVTNFSEWIAKMDDTGALDSFFTKAGDIAEDVLDIMESLASIAGSIIAILFDTKAGSTDMWENLRIALDDVAEWFKNPENQQKISDFLDKFGGAAFLVAGIIADADRWAKKFDEWGQKFENAKNQITGFFNGLGPNISGFFDDLGTKISQFPGKVGGWLSGLPGVVGGAASRAIGRLGYYIGFGIGSALKMFRDLPGNAWRALKALPDVVASVVRSAGNWLGSMGRTAWNAMRNVASNVSSGLSDLPNRMWNVGYNIVTGIWRGISAMAGWLRSQVYNFAANIWRGVQDALGISSPSKVMADRVGKWIPLGIAAGIDATSGSVIAAANRISSQLAGTEMAIPGVDAGALNGQLAAAANSTVNVTAANRKPQTLTVKWDVTGADSEMKRVIQKMIRTSNLLGTT